MSRCVVIHLESATERLPIIDKLRETMIHYLEVFSAKDGTEWEKSSKIAKRHPFEKESVKRGEIGCAHSHIDIIYTSLKSKEKHTLLFEDDCEMIGSRDDIYGFIHQAGKEWDILLLGANEYVESEAAEGLAESYKRVKCFWGAHAVILTEKAMRAALQAFADAQKQGIFLPADSIYNEAIKQADLVCYGPEKLDMLCRQKPGLVSAVTGKKR